MAPPVLRGCAHVWSCKDPVIVSNTALPHLACCRCIWMQPGWEQRRSLMHTADLFYWFNLYLSEIVPVWRFKNCFYKRDLAKKALFHYCASTWSDLKPGNKSPLFSSLYNVKNINRMVCSQPHTHHKPFDSSPLARFALYRKRRRKPKQVSYFWSVIRKCVMNWRLGEWDRFTALGTRCLKRITDKVIEEVLAAVHRKEKGGLTHKYYSDKLVLVYLGWCVL